MTEVDQLLPLREAVPAPLPSSGRPQPQERIRVIEPGRGSLKNLGRDLWEYRELLYFLTWRDIKVRYKQTVLGVLWAIIQPVMSMIVLSICFGRFAGLGKHTGGVPYPIFVYSGLLPWMFFANSLAGGSGSVVGNVQLVTKVQCPKIALPISSIAGGLVDLAISFAVLFALMLWYHVPLTHRLLLAPILVLGVAGIAFGFGAVFAALTVTYRDFRYVIPFMVQVWMFLTPVIYPVNVIPRQWRWLLSFNPLSGWISGFRSIFLGYPWDWPQLAVSALVTVIVLFGGAYYFRAAERRFADVI